jgi:hypothetical protein
MPAPNQKSIDGNNRANSSEGLSHLRGQEAEAMNSQGAEAFGNGAQGAQRSQEEGIDEVILQCRCSRPYKMFFDQEPRRRQGVANATPSTSTTASISQPAVTEESQICIICSEAFTNRSTLMPVGHEFDHECILPLFQSTIEGSHWSVILTCPLRRQRATLLGHTYTSRGGFEALEIIIHFLCIGNVPNESRTGPESMSNSIVDSHPHPHGSDGADAANPPPQLSQGRLEAQLDFDRINAMGPHELQNFYFYLRSMPGQIARLNRAQRMALSQRRFGFVELFGLLDPGDPGTGCQGADGRILSFPAFSDQDTLDFEAIFRLDRFKLGFFRRWLDRQGIYQRLTPTEREQLNERIRQLELEFREWHQSQRRQYYRSLAQD